MPELTLNKFEPFDPLEAKQASASEAAARALKREIDNVLSSYVGWYDPFCELIQNALDSVEERLKSAAKGYQPKVSVEINIKENQLSVTDNGVGLDEKKFKQFLAPSFSFKSGNTRGHKGVGATYLAYGFNFIQICTKTSDFLAIGRMSDARKWLSDPNPAGNPQVRFDDKGSLDVGFAAIDSGVSITIKFDETTHPRELGWIKASTADQWEKILRAKTGIGAIFENEKITIDLSVVDSEGVCTKKELKGIKFLRIHELVQKCAKFTEVKKKADELYTKNGASFKLPSKLNKLDVVFDTWDTNALASYISLDEEEKKFCEKHKPVMSFDYAYSAKVWTALNEKIGTRANLKILVPGIQIATNNMPQGELIQIPLVRNIGRQNQIQMVFHFENCGVDLGRKGFNREIVDFCKDISRKIVDGPLTKYRYCLKPVTGGPADLVREKEVDDWKDEMETHEKEHPISLVHENFFFPSKALSITSIPTREQDVIALFNQMIAGGVIRGIKIMSTNERLTYDGLFRACCIPPDENHLYDRDKNPLGILEETLQTMSGFTSKPKVLEYKYSLDALIEDFKNGDKNSNDIDLVVVWETGTDYSESYAIESLLIENNLSQRQYHGVTHTLTNLTSGQREMDLIVLSEMVDYLNDRDATEKSQKAKYEE